MGGEWPAPVFFHQDDPKKGFVYITLTFKGMKVAGLTKKEPTNATLVDQNIFPDAKTVQVTVNVTKSSGEEVTYEYLKKLPKEIVPASSKLKYKGENMIIEMKKGEAKLSWAPYASHLTSQS